MLVVFIVLVILPLLFRRHDAWVPSLVGATVVLTLAFEHLLHSTIGQNSALVPFTLVLLVCAGVSLAAEAVFARHMWEMAR
jgi:hypothetical protein